MGDLRPLVVGQAEQQAEDAGGVWLGELRDELDLPARCEPVDELVGERLESRPHRLDGPAAERGGEQSFQSHVVVALEAEERLAPPLLPRPVVDAVLCGPAGVALPEPAILQQGGALVVAQDRPAVRRLGVPPVVAGAMHGRRRDVEGGVGEVEMGNGAGHRGESSHEPGGPRLL